MSNTVQPPSRLNARPMPPKVARWARSINRLNSQTPMPLSRPTTTAAPPSTTDSEGWRRFSNRQASLICRSDLESTSAWFCLANLTWLQLLVRPSSRPVGKRAGDPRQAVLCHIPALERHAGVQSVDQPHLRYTRSQWVAIGERFLRSRRQIDVSGSCYGRLQMVRDRDGPGARHLGNF